MPKYFYTCNVCDTQISAFHSMTDKLYDCEKCNSVKSLRRLPSSFTLQKEETSIKTGALVEETINEIQQEITQHKEKIKSDLYEPSK